MKMKLILDVTDCMDCPMLKYHGGQGERWWHCFHKDSPNGYESIVIGWDNKFKGTPDWCPLKES